MRIALAILCLMTTGCTTKPSSQSFGLNGVINIGGCVRIYKRHADGVEPETTNEWTTPEEDCHAVRW